MKWKARAVCTHILSDSSEVVIRLGYFLRGNESFLSPKCILKRNGCFFSTKNEGKEIPWQRMGSELAESDQGLFYRQDNL